MLILTRKAGESLIVNENIEIKVVEVNGDKIKLGISAPKDVPILRAELCQTVESNKEAATGMSPSLLKSMLSTLKEPEQKD
ncbi:MAG: carbon storage regulator CsrA [Ruminococcus sp.]|nr:carbon storage regulator CsrA [Ruminococcus sp.]MBQ8905497.1 carbon storage regulator CsrA [Ruminococcus sp.]